MAIDVQELYRQKCGSFGQPANSKRFLADFISAVNRTLFDIENKAHYDATAITTPNSTISLASELESLVSLGTDYHLLSIGQMGATPIQEAFALYQDALATAQMKWFKDQADSEDLEVGLGDLSS